MTPPCLFLCSFCFAAAATLEDIEKTRAAFSDETTRHKEELAVQSAEKEQLKAQESELQLCQREKEEDLCVLTRSHEQERERNQQSLEQVRLIPLSSCFFFILLVWKKSTAEHVGIFSHRFVPSIACVQYV